MQANWNRIAVRGVQSAVVLAAFLPGTLFAAQNAQAAAEPENEIVQTIYLHHAAGQNDLNDIQTALRSTLRRSMFYGVASQDAIEFRGTPEDLATAQRIVADLDRPRKTYRLTYTITSSEGGKHSGAQSFTLLARLGDKADLDLNSRVPFATGASEGTASNTQWQYVSVGLHIVATLQGSPANLALQDRIDQSSTSGPESGTPAPTMSHAVLSNATSVTEGKPAVLGSLDIPGSDAHEQVEVVVTPAT